MDIQARPQLSPVEEAIAFAIREALSRRQAEPEPLRREADPVREKAA